MILCSPSYGLCRAMGVKIVSKGNLLIRQSVKLRYADGYLPYLFQHVSCLTLHRKIGCNAICNYESSGVKGL